ncbi:MAG: hypothetical protein J6U54_18940 [Clostridiales bacterium]|nr:hypothetical protein [Clostridiales bacterium]
MIKNENEKNRFLSADTERLKVIGETLIGIIEALGPIIIILVLMKG